MKILVAAMALFISPPSFANCGVLNKAQVRQAIAYLTPGRILARKFCQNCHGPLARIHARAFPTAHAITDAHEVNGTIVVDGATLDLTYAYLRFANGEWGNVSSLLPQGGNCTFNPHEPKVLVVDPPVEDHPSTAMIKTAQRWIKFAGSCEFEDMTMQNETREALLSDAYNETLTKNNPFMKVFELKRPEMFDSNNSAYASVLKRLELAKSKNLPFCDESLGPVSAEQVAATPVNPADGMIIRKIQDLLPKIKIVDGKEKVIETSKLVVPGGQLMMIKNYNPPASYTANIFAYADSDLVDLRNFCYYNLSPSRDFTKEKDKNEAYAVDSNTDSEWIVSKYYDSIKVQSRRIGEAAKECDGLPFSLRSTCINQTIPHNVYFTPDRFDITRQDPKTGETQTLSIYSQSSENILRCLAGNQFSILKNNQKIKMSLDLNVSNE